MSDKVFDQAYAEQYDLLYREKDYEAECSLLKEAFYRFSAKDVQTVLDLGCGTGNHAFPLARRGYRVTGVDLSAEMLARAQVKAAGLASSSGVPLNMPVFLQGDVRTLEAGQFFDAALMMFAVLGYQYRNEDVAAALRTVRRHLHPGGLFAFDVWYGPAVLAIRPSDRVKIIPIPGGRLIRAASGSLDTFHHLADVQYHLWKLQGSQVLAETEESHRMRYFFPQELAYFLQQAGLELKSLTAFPSLDDPASEATWNVLGVSTAL